MHIVQFPFSKADLKKSVPFSDDLCYNSIRVHSHRNETHAFSAKFHTQPFLCEYTLKSETERQCCASLCGIVSTKVVFHEQIQKAGLEHADLCHRFVRVEDPVAAADTALHRKHQPRRQQHQGTAGTDSKLSDSIITFSIADAVIRYGIDKNFDNRKIFTSACVTEAFGIGVLLLLSPLLNFLPYTEGYVVLLVIYCITSGFRQIASQFVRARGLVRLFAMDGILATLTLFIFNVTFIAGFHLGVTGFLISVILSDLLSGLFLWGVAGLHRFFRLRYMDKKILRMMLQFSIPLIPSALLWLVTGFSDRLFVRYMSGPAGLVGETAAGIYGVSTKIPNLISTISTIFFQAWNMSAIEENDSKDRSRFYHRVFDAYQSFMFIASAGLIVFVRILSNILIDSNTYPEYATAFTYTPVLIVGVLMMCFNQFLSSVYSATQHTTHSFWTSLVAAVVNIVLNIILIHIWGIMGAAIATFASYFVCYCIRIVDARKYVPFPVNHAKFAANTAALFLLGIVVVEAPPMWILILTVGFLFMVLYNFSAVTQTLARLKRR